MLTAYATPLQRTTEGPPCICWSESFVSFAIGVTGRSAIAASPEAEAEAEAEPEPEPEGAGADDADGATDPTADAPANAADDATASTLAVGAL